jgi:protein-S-isoprenylcysteine O-methyltransferase Ste14
VTNGWFRYTRNPMYLGIVLGCVGLAILLGSLGAWLPLPEFILILRVRFIRGEEALLEDTFGEEYLRYKSKVRRWL